MTSAPLPASTFVERFLRLNGLDAGAFAGWELLPGMGFGERGAWWSDGADRGAPHEGLDLRRVRTRDGRGATLGPGTRIPVLWPGTVAAVASDFLGRSVFVAHEPVDGAGRRLHAHQGGVVARERLRRLRGSGGNEERSAARGDQGTSAHRL